MVSFPPTALLSAGYALLLAAVAVGLEQAARYSHRRSRQYEIAGFSYESDNDRWRCPAGQHLWRHRFDHGSGRLVYKAQAHHCNHCHAKPDCTDSDDGRELAMSPQRWVETTMARFHRGLSLVLLLLAELILAGTALYLPPSAPADALLGCMMVAYGVAGVQLGRVFFKPISR